MSDSLDSFPHGHVQRRWHTTTFRWLSIYAIMLGLSVMAMMGFIGWLVTTTMESDIDTVMKWQLLYFESIPDDQLSAAIQWRLDDQSTRANHYGLFTADGRYIAGDILAIPPDLPAGHPGQTLKYPLTLTHAHVTPTVRAMIEPRRSGEQLVIARDLTRVLRIRQTMIKALVGGGLYCLFVGIASGFLLCLRQTRRVREIRRVTLQIAQGDLNQRLPVSGRDELDMLAQLVNHMLEEVERLMTEVKSACDGIAHDLRTPLAHVRMLLGRAAERTRNMEDKSVAGMLDQARVETDALLDRFRAMLRISEIGTLKRRGGFSTVQLESLVKELCELYEPLADDRSIRWLVHLETVQEIQGDRALLFEAFSNLLDNAIKFAPAGGVVRVELTPTARGSQLVISDNGPGIPRGERKAVLQRFYRGEQTRHVAGSGLGLGIVDAIVRLHDFVLRIGSAHPGTTMTVECWPHTLQYAS